ncbi:PRC-barrel domain-containing protein [Streptomyces sp. NPDC006691]|uniref:PRC-barrel domain-containing protein n=1 Tax=Streptomyces sp. NPDC006691 TaxID=3364757 RepID=UPI00367979ED
MGHSFHRPEELTGLVAYDPEGERIGGVEQVYVDDCAGRPEWVTVKTGLFGTKESLAPLAGARREGNALHIAHAKTTVKDAPRHDVHQHLTADEERELYRHYGVDGHGTNAPTPGAESLSAGPPGASRTGTPAGGVAREPVRARLRKVGRV